MDMTIHDHTVQNRYTQVTSLDCENILFFTRLRRIQKKREMVYALLYTLFTTSLPIEPKQMVKFGHKKYSLAILHAACAHLIMAYLLDGHQTAKYLTKCFPLISVKMFRKLFVFQENYKNV